MRRNSVLTAFMCGTFAFGVLVAASDAEARLDMYVDKSMQQIRIIQNGTLLYVWPVSTGRDRFSTPNGVYTPERLERSWFSRAYYNAPMPHAIFFHNGYAIHGSYDIARLGGPASHGCVRLHPRNAALLFAMVQQEGQDNTTIFVGGDSRRPLLRYRDDEEAWRPPYRRGAPIARGYPPEPGIDSRTPPRDGPDRYVDRLGAYPQSGSEQPYYAPDRYDGSDRYADQGRYPRGPNVAPYPEADRPVDRRVPHGPRLAPGDGADPYVDGRGGPRGPAGGFSPYYPSDRGSDGRGAGPRGPKAPPYDADRYADAPPRRGDGSPLAMRGADPANRLPPQRLDREAPAERMPVERMPLERMPVERMPVERLPVDRLPVERLHGPRGVPRPATASAKPRPVLPPAPTPAVSPPPAPAPAPVARQDAPPPEQQELFGYKVLPKSYWTGASWRWRMKREEEAAPPASSR